MKNFLSYPCWAVNAGWTLSRSTIWVISFKLTSYKLTWLNKTGNTLRYAIFTSWFPGWTKGKPASSSVMAVSFFINNRFFTFAVNERFSKLTHNIFFFTFMNRSEDTQRISWSWCDKKNSKRKYTPTLWHMKSYIIMRGQVQ